MKFKFICRQRMVESNTFINYMKMEDSGLCHRVEITYQCLFQGQGKDISAPKWTIDLLIMPGGYDFYRKDIRLKFNQDEIKDLLGNFKFDQINGRFARKLIETCIKKELLALP